MKGCVLSFPRGSEGGDKSCRNISKLEEGSGGKRRKKGVKMEWNPLARRGADLKMVAVH